jgi:hypothetical protein
MAYGLQFPESRMNSVMERWTGSCRRELLDRTLIWNQRHLMTVLREYGASATRTGRTGRVSRVRNVETVRHEALCDRAG